jgi:peptidoglycan/xylan/chitin deacetylase (PgdA/CDA1 family)
VKLPILLYHHVGPTPPGWLPAMSVAPERFAWQMGWLAARGYRGIAPADWTAWRAGRTALPERPVMVTFDDGFADLAEHAFPVLERLGFRAALYVVSRPTDGARRWAGPAAPQLISDATLRDWNRRGIEIGAHGRTHADLTTLDVAVMEDEIAGSRADLEQRLGEPIASFAYPFGHWNASAHAIARRHFDNAITCDEGLNDRDTDPWALRRTMVQPFNPMWDMKLQTRLGWSPLEAVRRLRRRRSGRI